ncbi:MAG: hypothetical protein WCG29_11965 [Desulfomonile sp.]|jgi:hypothetical protein|nr:hypothetical protein [Deltaproteobacteria bacterium]
MERFEYDITSHSAETFNRVVYFCSEKGDCGIKGIPNHEPQILVDILNERGRHGWELVQIMFGKDGLLACWKHKLVSPDE